MKLVRTLTKIIPESHALFLGNSLPVREVDFYGSGNGSEVKVGLNRGPAESMVWLPLQRATLRAEPAFDTSFGRPLSIA